MHHQSIQIESRGDELHISTQIILAGPLVILVFGLALEGVADNQSFAAP